MDFKRLFLTQFTGVLLTVTSAFCAAIPAPIFQSALNTQTGVGNLTSSTTGTLSRGSNYITVGGEPGGFIRAHDQESDYGQSGVSANIFYTIQLLGGDAGDRVPISIDGYLWTTASAGADDGGAVINSDASLSISAANGNSGAQMHVSCGNVVRGQDCSNSMWRGTLSVIAWAGYDINIGISASAGVCCGQSSMVGDAYADPFVYIDPQFAALHPEYSLAFPQGIGNTLVDSAAPEPASLALSLGGLAALAGLTVRKRRAAAALNSGHQN
ncbi:MAG: hypothetical protein JWN34_5367 [Bryobacterales bacterium]|jgi:hypothetical protein|nr:hypothetical protein [Bryobacterales bacterium]